MSNSFPEIKRVCVFGVGGVGGYFGGKIARFINDQQSKKYEIYFIARGEHLKAIRQSGIVVKTPEVTIAARPTLATSDVGEIPSPDLILLCVKSYDLSQAVISIKSIVHHSSVIIPLLNGIDINDRIRELMHTGMVMPACVYLGTHIERPGIINQSGGNGAIILGPESKYQEYDGENIKTFFREAEINFEWHNDPFPPIWEKYIFIAGFGLVSAFTGKTLGAIMEGKECRDMVRGIMEEIYLISKLNAINLPENIVERSINKAYNFPYDARTSFQRDIENKSRFNEGDLLGGTIIRKGKSLGIPTPITESIYRQIIQRQV